MFSVSIRIEGIERRRRSAGLQHIVIGFFLILKTADFYRILAYAHFLYIFPFLLIGGLSLFYGFFRNRMDPYAQYNYWMRLVQVVGFTVLGVLMNTYDKNVEHISVFVFAAVAILLMFSERRIFHETVLHFDSRGVRIPGYYREHLVKWEELTDITVREDFITIFHIKKKYLQFQVVQDLSTLEVAKLNAFCREQLEGKEVRKVDGLTG